MISSDYRARMLLSSAMEVVISPLRSWCRTSGPKVPGPRSLWWPAQPTVCQPQRFPTTAAIIARLFSRASTELTRIRAEREL
jgi:hypothetical protein